MSNEITRIIANTAYQTYEKRLFKEVMEGTIPEHVAIIMDGNRRFAQEIGLAVHEGHVKGKDKLEEVMEWCQEMGIRVLTVFAFSTENLQRDEGEVQCLMDLFEESFLRLAEDERIHENRIRVTVLGQRELLPERVIRAIEVAEGRTRDYDQYFYNIAIAYGSRQEMIMAIKRIAAKVKEGELAVDDIDEKVVSSFLYTADFKDPDLVLRTSGEERVSNFLLWQLAYSELYFTDVYWPGFRKVDFLRAIRTYQARQRRFGK
ncbi:MAG TPA: polyprenyl diphosphate synthase [Methanomassiliicoccales archaeon]|jgi:tritrans,polycis-undecaprenyl-diphosphate synthase [geranylgeranyl-diphosphate specific]|nr:di-trans,poly-cis-decaprenylcistransferase [Euryarchaeota archaeon]HOE52245.1 polyprenyl diphosphate synthase [Methanomassiliicoccales archaeon]HQM66689.1 polyprenyl diphosphate synthase [Methanomassiliicoccales archaeon]HRU12068.1 polyprenyl diphosphate synthase [Methanomassiliicoccales archaeon]